MDNLGRSGRTTSFHCRERRLRNEISKKRPYGSFFEPPKVFIAGMQLLNGSGATLQLPLERRPQSFVAAVCDRLDRRIRPTTSRKRTICANHVLTIDIHLAPNVNSEDRPLDENSSAQP